MTYFEKSPNYRIPPAGISWRHILSTQNDIYDLAAPLPTGHMCLITKTDGMLDVRTLAKDTDRITQIGLLNATLQDDTLRLDLKTRSPLLHTAGLAADNRGHVPGLNARNFLKAVPRWLDQIHQNPTRCIGDWFPGSDEYKYYLQQRRQVYDVQAALNTYTGSHVTNSHIFPNPFHLNKPSQIKINGPLESPESIYVTFTRKSRKFY